MEAIGRFVVLERLGVGAHAAVYRAEDPVLEQFVALKVLSTQVAFDPDGRARFIKEARLMRRIHDGTGMGLLWRVVIFIGGVIPAVLAVTGIMMWLNVRRRLRAMDSRREGRAEYLAPAE